MTTKTKMMETKLKDNWVRESPNFCCATCMYYLAKSENIGRCKFSAPTREGFPVVFPSDAGCGKHKLRTF